MVSGVVVAEADGGPGHNSRGRGDEDEVGPAGEGDVLDAARVFPPGSICVDPAAGRDGERLFGDKAEGRLRGDDADGVIGLPEAPDHPRRLVRRDPARHAHDYVGHAGSIQSPQYVRPRRKQNAEVLKCLQTSNMRG